MYCLESSLKIASKSYLVTISLWDLELNADIVSEMISLFI